MCTLDIDFLEQNSRLNMRGHYRDCYESLRLFLPQAEQLSQSNEQQILMLQYYSLLGTVALKLSILNVAHKCVITSIDILKKYPYRDEQYYLFTLENGLILQKIEYWLCRYNEAIDINIGLLKMCDMHMKSDERWEIMSQLGNTYRSCSMYEQAGEAYSNSTNLGPLLKSNVLFVMSRYQMDTDHSQKGLDIANEYINIYVYQYINIRCLSIRENYYRNINSNHIDISLVHELQSKLYFSLGLICQAEQQHNLAYDNKIKVLGLYNFDTIDSINERGRILLSKKKQEEAKYYFKQLGEISLQLLGPNNQYEALSFNNLGCSYYNDSKFEESIANHVKAVKFYEDLYGFSHYKLVFALNQMAYAHKQLGRYKVAVQLWRKCICILQKVVGPPTQKNILVMTQQINDAVVQYEE